MNLHDWIDELCDVLELEDVEIDEGLLTDLAQTVGRRVDPAAAAVTTFLVGLAAARNGGGLPLVEELAERTERLVTTWSQPVRSTTLADPPADEGGGDYSGELDLGAGDEDDAADLDDLAEVG